MVHLLLIWVKWLEGSSVSEKPNIYVDREPAPAFFPAPSRPGFQNRDRLPGPQQKTSFLPTAKKSLYILPHCLTWTLLNNYSTKLAADIPYYSIWSAADPCLRSCARCTELYSVASRSRDGCPSSLLIFCIMSPCYAADLIMLMITMLSNYVHEKQCYLIRTMISNYVNEKQDKQMISNYVIE